jgi:hypothetical protein
MPNLPDGKKELQQSQLFDAETLGLSFQQLAVDVVKGESTDFMSRWFRSTKGEADLVIWTDGEKRIIKHQLCFYGQVVDWNPINGTRTGLIIEEEVFFGEMTPTYSDVAASSDSGLPVAPHDGEVSETIRFDQVLQRSVVAQAIELLLRVPSLNEEDRSSLIYNLKQSPKLHKNARERALKVWAPKVDEITSTTRPTFWKRLRQWVIGDS